jgi:hypothetical protein
VSPSPPQPAADVQPIRPFGLDAADMEIDLHGLAQPVAAIAVVAACCAAGRSEVASWTIARRLDALIDVAIASLGQRLSSIGTCGRLGCSGLMELVLDLVAFRGVSTAGDVACSVEPDRRVTAALPTGEDQLRWLSGGISDPLTLASGLVRSVDGEPVADGWWVPAAWLPAIEGAFEAADPLSALELIAVCPECGEENRVAFDLEAFLLTRLRQRQARLVDEIHCLALHYHWSERDIVAMPAGRRAEYLRRLGAGGVR